MGIYAEVRAQIEQADRASRKRLDEEAAANGRANRMSGSVAWVKRLCRNEGEGELDKDACD